LRAALLAALLSVYPALAAAAPREGTGTPESQVVSLAITFQSWDQDRPWAKKNPQVRRAESAVVAGPYLLTTASVLADATHIEVEKRGRPVRATVRPALVDAELDLALLAVDEPGFFQDLTPVRLAPHVPTGAALRTARWRNRQLEMSTSRVTRVEVQASLFGAVEHPFVLVTTDLSGGGWGEPVFSDGTLVGISASQNDQSARIIAVDVIAAFLREARRPQGYRGTASLGFAWQVNEDPALAAYLGLPGPLRGVVVTGIPWGTSADGVLRPRDVLLSLDGKPLDASGYYAHPRYGELRFTNIASDGHAPGDRLPAVVWREGKEVRLDIPLRRASSALDLIPNRQEAAPPYLVAGGLVFRELDGPYLRSWGDEWRKRAPMQLVVRSALFSDAQGPERRRVVLVSTVLPSAYNLGYHDVADLEVSAINGVVVDSVAKAGEALRHPRDGFHRISLRPNFVRNEIVLDAAGLEQATEEALAAYRIPAAMRLSETPPETPPAP
jgi:S1-C subfamily serine protease